LVPKFIAEIEEALAARGRGDLSPQLSSATVERYTYDTEVEAGFIYLVRAKVGPHFANLPAPVAETIPFIEQGFNVDLDHDGQLFGIEFLSRPDILAALRGGSAR
jgi:uncharacterized protein YuzE